MSSCRPGLKLACMMNRWGSNSDCSERAPDTAAAKEAEAKVAAMIQERARQDAELWGHTQIQDPIKKSTTK
jgi:hypothetical protein|uniref:Uncharacterized protein n=1 Tax=viral metagenome TaxID=1070528 RepID=A0A6C0K738_9ZZZZ